MNSNLKRMTLLAAPLLFAFVSAEAQLVAAPQGAFVGATVVDFNATANGAYVGNQYGGSGVTFSGALYGMTNQGDLNQFPSSGGGVIASNWLYSQGGGSQGLSFTAQWTGLQSMLGFYLENWPTQVGTVEVFNGALSLGSIAFAPTSSLQAQFFGLSSAVGFDKAVFTNTSALNGFYAIDNFQYVAASTVTPEPASVVLVASGLLGIFSVVRKRRETAT
jgi:hypothetical protein